MKITCVFFLWRRARSEWVKTKKLDKHFALFSGSSLLADCYEIWHTMWSRRHNHVYRIFSQLVQGLRSSDTPKLPFPVDKGCRLTTVLRLNCASANVDKALFNPLMATLKPQRNDHWGLCSNMAIGTLAVAGWAVTFGTARMDLSGLWSRPVPSSLYQM